MLSFIPIVFIASKEHSFCSKEKILYERKLDSEFCVKSTFVLLATLNVLLLALADEGELKKMLSLLSLNLCITWLAPGEYQAEGLFAAYLTSM